MAIYVFQMKTFSRAAGHRGSRATSAAAYRAGERIRDQRTGAIYDHRRRQDVLHKEIVLPAALGRAGAGMEWARNRATLWNAAEHAESRKDARVAREFMVALPHELRAEDRLTLARGFARELVERYHNAVDLVIHAPRGDERNFHAHLLATTREVSSDGLGRKAALELSGTERHRQGLPRWREERTFLRERWADLTNQALSAAHLDVRVSHEYAARGLTQQPRLPLIAYHIERRGGHSVVAERLRERHRAALEAPARSLEPAASHDGLPAGMRWLEQVRERARSAWLAMRQRMGAEAPAARAAVLAEPSLTPERQLGLQSAGSVRSASVDWGREGRERWLAYKQQLASGQEMATQPTARSKSLQQALPEGSRREVERSNDFDLSL